MAVKAHLSDFCHYVLSTVIMEKFDWGLEYGVADSMSDNESERKNAIAFKRLHH
jgi:hypothetical protein